MITSNIGENVKLFVCGKTKAPERRSGPDAGIDLFVPDLTEQFIQDLTEKNPGQPYRWGLVGAPQTEEDLKDNKGVYLYLPPHEDLLIPTYVKTRFPENMCLRISNKSGIATKQKFIVGAEIVDASYEGIIHVHIFNASNALRFIEFGQKIAQAIPIIIDPQNIEVFYDNKIEDFKEFKNFIPVEEFYEGHDTTRKEGAFGSTGTK